MGPKGGSRERNKESGVAARRGSGTRVRELRCGTCESDCGRGAEVS